MSEPAAVERDAEREASPPRDGGWTGMAMLMAGIALVLPTAIAVVARKFGLIFADLGLRLSPATELWLRPIVHVSTAFVLIAVALTATRARVAWVFGLAAFLYVAATVVLLFLPLIVTIETVGTAP
jgi:hypothetical protein